MAARSVELSLAADPPVFPCLAEYPLCEIETLVCFRELLLEVLDDTFNRLEPGSDVGRWRLWTRGTQTSDLEHREGRDPHEYQERDKKHSRVQVPFLLSRLSCRRPARRRKAAGRQSAPASFKRLLGSKEPPFVKSRHHRHDLRLHLLRYWYGLHLPNLGEVLHHTNASGRRVRIVLDVALRQVFVCQLPVPRLQ